MNDLTLSHSPRRWLLAALAVMYAVMWVGGVGGHLLTGHAPADAMWAAPVFLLLAGLITLSGASRGEAAALALAAAVGLVAEIVGSKTGLIFGGYGYTDALGPRLLAVPVVMASAWMVLVGYVREMLRPFELSWPAEVVIAAAWMTAIDLLIDPLAAGPLGYWRWAAPGAYYGVPARNFLGWFLVSLLIFALVKGFAERGHSRNSIAQFVGVSIIVFFALIALAHRMILAVAVAVLLCAAHLARSFYRRQHARRVEGA
ncbi:MAG TPA: carotenoid biosynthesis protein [Blastocatellia bacterium]|nr:carotenoid biosynthesis protein [Blastocatellia bacterium]